jgi:P4 family phage/plasmid primase-like protien
MNKTKKPASKFYTAVTYALARGLPVESITDFAKDFDISDEKINEFIKNKSLSRAISGAVVASKDEKEMIYNMLDQKFIDHHSNIVIFRRGENTDFYEYINGVYRMITRQEMYDYIDSLMSKFSLFDYRTSSRTINDTINRIGSLLSRTKDRFFTDTMINSQKWFLNLKNGLLDLNNFELKPHEKSYFSTVQVPFVYDPTQNCPEFLKFIEKISGNNESTALMLQEMYGYCLMDGNPKHKVFYLYGDTARNGKSTTAKILCGLIGWGNISTLSLLQIAGENSSILTSIVGKQLNFSDEISSKFIESSRLTAMSAEGIIEINPKYKHSYLYQVKAKFIIACNDLPRFKDSQGMKHRMIPIPFPYQLREDERIEKYDEILLAKEGSGILNWAIKGAIMIRNNKVFTTNEESQEDMLDNLYQSNSTYAYLENEFLFSDEHDTEYSVMDLYGEKGDKDSQATGFRLFCLRNGIGETSLFNFQRELKRFANETKKIKQVRKLVKNKYKRVYVGLKLRKEDEDEEVLNNFVNSIDI